MTARKSDVKKLLYSETAVLGKALSSPKRLELLDLLCQGTKAVETLASQSGMDIKLTSAHLKELRRARLVQAQRDGKYVFYSLRDAEVSGLWVALRSLAQKHASEIQVVLSEFQSKAVELAGVARKTLLSKAAKGEIVVLDVRPKEEYEAAHLPNARSVPLGELKKTLRRLPKTKKIVAYCRGPFCVLAVQAVTLLRRHGFNAYRLSDGIADWQAAGLPIARGGNKNEDTVYTE